MNPNSPFKSLFLRIRQTWFSDKNIYLLLIGIGITLRLVQYFHNRSLWGDEARLAIGITDFSISILKPLPHKQVAPILFLMIERLFVFLFGNNEFSLRAFPLICSIATLFLIKKIAKQITKNEKIALVSLLLFSISPLLIFYSSEIKQYSSDVFTFLILTSLALGNLKDKVKIYWLTLVGIISIFLSNISIFVLFYIYIILLFNQLIEKKIDLHFIISSILLLFSFAINYYFFIYAHPTRNFMIKYWDFAFMNFNPFSIDFWNWLATTFVSFFRKLFFVRFKLPWPVYGYISIISGLFIVGILKGIKKRDYLFLYLTFFPILLHLVISSFRIYPFAIRLILYLSPVFLIIISSGMFEIFKLLKSKKYKKILSILLFICLLGMIILNGKHFPIEKAEIRKSMTYISKHYTTGDKIIVSDIASKQFNYYLETGLYNFNRNSIYFAKDFKEMENQFSENSHISNGIWFVFSHDAENHKKEIIELKKEIIKKGDIIHLIKPTGSLAFKIQTK